MDLLEQMCKTSMKLIVSQHNEIEVITFGADLVDLLSSYFFPPHPYLPLPFYLVFKNYSAILERQKKIGGKYGNTVCILKRGRSSSRCKADANITNVSVCFVVYWFLQEWFAKKENSKTEVYFIHFLVKFAVFHLWGESMRSATNQDAKKAAALLLFTWNLMKESVSDFHHFAMPQRQMLVWQ